MEDNRILEELGENLTDGAPDLAAQTVAVADTPPEAPASVQWSEKQTLIEVPDLPPQKPKTKLPIALISVVAVILVIMVGAYASGMIANPERAVHKALTATGEAMERHAEKIANEIQFLNKSTDGGVSAPSKTAFSFTFEGLKGENLPPEMALITNMIRGMGVQGSYTSDPAGMTDEFDGALVLNDFHLFSLYAFSSPDQLAVGLPSLLDTAYSINPKTFSADIQQSPLYTMLGLTPEAVAEAQESFDSQYGDGNALYGLDYKQMQTDIRAIFAKAIEHAQYKSAGRKDGLKQYTVSVPGEDLKTAFSALIRYVYLESEMKNLFKTALEPALAYEGMTYEAFIEQMVLAPFTSLPNLPATLTLGVDKTVKTAQLEIIPDLSVGTGVDVMDRIAVDFTRTDNGDQSMRFTFGGELSTEPFLMTVDVEETYMEGAYAINISGKMEAAEANLSFEESVKLNKSGAVGLLLDLNFDDGVENGGFGINLDGTIKKDGDKTSYDFPTVQLRVNYGLTGEYSVFFKLKADTEPVQTPVVPARPSKPVLAMNEEELYADMTLLMEQAEALESAISGMFGLDAFVAPFAELPAA